MKNFLISLAFLVPSALAEVVVSHAQVREAIPGAPNTAAFMTLENRSEQAVRIVRAESDLAKRVELHTHTHDDGVMRMREVDAIEIPQGERVQLKPGGLHVMFLGLNQRVKQGDQINFDLITESGTRIPVSAEVKKIQPMQHGKKH